MLSLSDEVTATGDADSDYLKLESPEMVICVDVVDGSGSHVSGAWNGSVSVVYSPDLKMEAIDPLLSGLTAGTAKVVDQRGYVKIRCNGMTSQTVKLKVLRDK